MNEKIKELVEKAKSNEPFECSLTKQQWIEKFAQLIIDECVYVAVCGTEENDDVKELTYRDASLVQMGRNMAMEDIKKHFGF